MLTYTGSTAVVAASIKRRTQRTAFSPEVTFIVVIVLNALGKGHKGCLKPAIDERHELQHDVVVVACHAGATPRGECEASPRVSGGDVEDRSSD